MSIRHYPLGRLTHCATYCGTLFCLKTGAFIEPNRIKVQRVHEPSVGDAVWISFHGDLLVSRLNRAAPAACMKHCCKHGKRAMSAFVRGVHTFAVCREIKVAPMRTFVAIRFAHLISLQNEAPDMDAMVCAPFEA